MPRRTTARCSRKGHGPELSAVAELHLCDGHAFGVFDLKIREQLQAPWRAWGPKITRNWIAAFPGSRPMALYLFGEIEPPAWEHDLPGLRHPLPRVAGIDVVIADAGWHRRRPELDHLVQLGVVDGAEYRRAVERLAGPDGTYPGRYQSVSRDE